VRGLSNPSGVPNLKWLASAVAEILKGNPKNLGSYPSPRSRPFFFWWDSIMGKGKP